MPRQAARLVLGRSSQAKTAATSAYQSFSTTPRHFANDNDANNNSRRGRSAAAASALGAMGSSSSSSSSPSSSSRTPSSFGRQGFSAAPSLNRGRPGSNIISLKSLPVARKPAQLGGSGDKPAPGTPGFVPRFAGRDGSSRGGGTSVGRGRGGFSQGGFVANTRGDSTRGGFSRGGGGRGRAGRGGHGRGRRGGGSSQGVRDGEFEEGEGGEGGEAKEPREEDHRKVGEGLLKTGINTMGGEVEVYTEDLRLHGPERKYTPSTTLESLVQWGPAVATNNALGQSAMAIRSMRLMGGGRRFHEHEQTFDVNDEIRWRSMGKPIFYSSVEQKAAALKMLNPEKREREVQNTIDRIVKSLQEKHGKNWTAFAEEYDKLGEKKIRSMAEELADANFARHVNDAKLRATKNNTTREAIAKFVLKGEHPEVKLAEGTLAKAARYHASTPTYRPADGAKFDEKLKQLVRS